MLPVDRFDHVGVREVDGGLAVDLGALSEDEGAIVVSLLDPASASAQDLDQHGLRSAIVPDAMDLVREGEVDGRDLAVVDVAKDVGEGLARGEVDLVEGAEGRRVGQLRPTSRERITSSPDVVGRRHQLEAMREALRDELGDEFEDGRSMRVVGAQEEGGGQVGGGDRVAVIGVLSREGVGGGEVVGREG